MWKHRSSWIVTLCAGALALSGIGTAPLGAQTPEQAKIDSLVLQLEDAEAMLEMLRQQIGTVAEAGVRTRSRYSMEISGRVLMNVFRNSKETDNADVPMYRMQVPDGSLKGGTGMTVRQTALSAAVTAHDILGGTFRGDVDVDFFGGQMPSTGGRTFPLMRIRTARAIVDWQRSQLLIGQEQPLVANLNPISLAALGTPNFSYSGNLWHWIPQIRYGVRTGGALRFGLQGAILAPIAGEPVGEFTTGFDAAERSNVPSLQARTHVTWGDERRQAEIGVGFHYAQLLDAAEEKQQSNAVTLDFIVPFLSRFELRGEAFSGQALQGLGGGGIGQNFGSDDVTPLKTIGGWVQLNYDLTSRILVGAGYGFDDPDDDVLTAPGVKVNNSTTEAHIHWRPAGPLVFGLEWRSTATKYDASSYANTHFNLAFGFEF